MNVLLFVTCFLLILSTLTYAKIDSFRYFMSTQAQFEFYMHQLENAYTNKAAEKWYETTIANKHSAGPAPRGSPPTSSSPRLSFKILIDTEMQAKNPIAYAHALTWAKTLMQNLYGKYAFYQEAVKKRPSFADELLARLNQAVEELPPQLRPKSASELANLVLGDEFDEIFYLMLKGNPTPTSRKEKQAAKNELSYIAEGGPAEDEQDIAQAALERVNSDGYDSLLNYITLQNTTKVRVFLAPREVLRAIFGQAEIAQSIIQTRYECYQSVMRGELPESATKQFQINFEGYMQGHDAELLDFRVSKTNPLKYN